MPDPIDIAQLCQGLDVHLAHLAAAQDRAPDPGTQEFVGSLIDKIRAGRDYFQNDYQNRLQEADQRVAQSIDAVEKKKQQFQQMEQKHAAAAAAKAKKAAVAKEAIPPAPKEPPLDAKLGPLLRRELLKRFAGEQHSQPLDLGPREIWEDWDGWSNN